MGSDLRTADARVLGLGLADLRVGPEGQLDAATEVSGVVEVAGVAVHLFLYAA